MNKRKTKNTESKEEFQEEKMEIRPEPQEAKLEIQEVTQLLNMESLKDEEIMRTLASDGAKILISETTTPILYTKEQINGLIEKLANYKRTSKGAIIIAIEEFFRQRGANASISALKKVRLICPEQKTEQYLYAQEILNVLITKIGSSQKANLRTLAESMAPSMLRGLIILKEKNPTLMLDGDLAKVLDRDLYQEKAPPLTSKERIGAATYYQWMPDLDLIVGSDRLRTLLFMNLKKRTSQQIQKKQKKKTEEKNKKIPNQPAKGRKENMANNIQKKANK